VVGICRVDLTAVTAAGARVALPCEASNDADANPAVSAFVLIAPRSSRQPTGWQWPKENVNRCRHRYFKERSY
jgi:hypothetical protein